MKTWPTRPLGEVCAINPKLAASEAPAADAEVTFVPMAAVDEVSGTIARPELRRYSQVAKGYTAFRENDVLFAKITPCMQNGKAAIARDLCGGLGFGSTEFHVLRPTTSLLPQWVFALIRQPSFRLAAVANLTGTAGQQRVPVDFVKAFSIPVPPLAEQERIVKLLDEADDLRKLRAEADRRTAALLPALFHEMFGDPGINPHGWPTTKLEEIADKVTDGEHLTPKRTTSGIKLLSARNVRDGFLDFRDVDYVSLEEHQRINKRCNPENGDILISCSGTIGRVAVVATSEPFSLVRSVALVKPKKGVVRPEFLAHYLRTPFMGGQMTANANASSQANLFQNQIRRLPIFIPDINVQDQFEERVTEIRELEACQAASRRRVDDLFQSLLHRAFQGAL